MQQLVGVFVDEDHELLRRRKAVENLDATAHGRSQRTAQIVSGFERDTAFDDGCAQRRSPATGIAGRLGRLGKGFAISLREVLSRDSASHGNAASVAEGDTCMARIRGAHDDAFRTGLPRLFKNVDPFRKPEASGKPCGVRTKPLARRTLRVRD